MMELEVKYFKGYEIIPWRKDDIILEVDYEDLEGEPSFVALDAIEVYNNLKRYFKDTEYE